MASHGEPGQIQVTDRVRRALGPEFRLRCRGEIEIKGKGPVTTYLLEGVAAAE